MLHDDCAKQPLRRVPSSIAAAMVIAIACGGDVAGSTTTGAARETVIYAFAGPPDGAYPTGNLLALGSALYGTTTAGGGTNCGGVGCGTVFRLIPTSSGYSESRLYVFAGCADGGNPSGGLVADAAGALYGTTLGDGGQGRCGTGYGVVFKLTRSGSGYVETVIHAFGSHSDGAYPNAGLVVDGSGAIFGTTSGGGSASCDCGIVYKLTPTRSGYTETVLHRFGGQHDGSQPDGGLTAGANGSLYGTTEFGNGRGPYGTVFEVTHSHGYRERILHWFHRTRRGANPTGNVVVDFNGNVYGVTVHGGAYGERGSSYGNGAVFRLTAGSKGYGEAVIHSFRLRTDGEGPYGLTVDGSGALYTTTCCFGAAGAGYGSVVKLSPSSSGQYAETVLYHFKSLVTGASPYGGVIFGTDGALYGTTSEGGRGCGSYGCGTVYKLDSVSGVKHEEPGRRLDPT